MNKGRLVTVAIVVAVLILAAGIIYYRNNSNPQTPDSVAKCIGEKSVVYIQNGCIHCIRQEQLFGESFKFLSYVNCTENWNRCTAAGIEGTPTWIINNQRYIGYQDLSKLQELTGC